MFIYVTICVTLLTIIAGMHLILKSNSAPGTSAIFKWISYFIVLVGLLILLCQVVRGISRMRHHGDKDGYEECYSGMHGMSGCCMMMSGHGGMKCCDMEEEEGDACCDMKMKGDSAEHMMKHNEDAAKAETEEKK
jgi:hypothetical protein